VRTLLVSALALAGLCVGAVQASAATTTVPAAADSWVDSKAPTTNRGSETLLKTATGGPYRNIYLRFNVSGLSGSVTKATLQLVTQTDSAKGVSVGPVADNTWGESTITWANAPAIGSAVAGIGSFNAGDTVSIDVTPLVKGNGAVSMGITTTALYDKTFGSRESSSRPQLVVETSGSTSPPPSPTPTPTPTPTPPPPSSSDPVIGAAGDIACAPSDSNFNSGYGTTNYCRQRDTAKLLTNTGLSEVITLGDNQYENGEGANFSAVFNATWGAARAMMRPAVGNREYNTSGASGYFNYFNGTNVFGGPAGDRDKGYFSFDIGAWHLISLNSNCSSIGGCYAGSAQEKWLRGDLATHKNTCTLAYWHHPLWTSGQTGNSTNVRPLFQALYDNGAELVLSAHDHDYERFVPQSPTGAADPSRGIRQIVAGTGGESHHPFTVSKLANEEVRNDNTFGVLRLSLHPSSYDWKFQPIAGQTFTDSGSTACH
jgi:hypothetical protein